MAGQVYSRSDWSLLISHLALFVHSAAQVSSFLVDTSEAS